MSTKGTWRGPPANLHNLPRCIVINATARFELARIKAAGERAFPKLIPCKDIVTVSVTLRPADHLDHDGALVWDEAELREAMRSGFGFEDANPSRGVNLVPPAPSTTK